MPTICGRYYLLCVWLVASAAAVSLHADRALGQFTGRSNPNSPTPWGEYFRVAGDPHASSYNQATGYVSYASTPADARSAMVPAAHFAGKSAGCTSCANCSNGSCSGCASGAWYLGVSGGWQHRETVHEANDPQTFIEFRNGFAANAALGYRFDPFRIEAEYSFMNNDVDTAGSAGLSSPAAGTINLRAFMFNVYHDVQLDLCCWQPYVGAGIGLYQSEINSLYPDFFTVAGAPLAGTAVNTTSDMPLAYQFRLGVTRPLGARTDFYTGYRYFRGEELEFAAPPFSQFAPTFHPEGAKVHSIELGLRVNF